MIAKLFVALTIWCQKQKKPSIFGFVFLLFLRGGDVLYIWIVCSILFRGRCFLGGKFNQSKITLTVRKFTFPRCVFFLNVRTLVRNYFGHFHYNCTMHYGYTIMKFSSVFFWRLEFSFLFFIQNTFQLIICKNNKI